MKPIAKTLIGLTAACATTLAAATPAFADPYDRDDDGIGVGEIIAGALVIGGVAALAGAFDNDRYDDRYRDRDRYYDDRNYRRIGSRAAVESCIRTAEQRAYRAGFRRVKVTDIRDVDRKSYGYKVKGRIAVDNGFRGGRYGRGWDRDYRGWNNSMQGWDSGKFSCKIDGRGVREIDYSGVRGLR
ncbi:MAG: hypothetical protein CL820_09065 [Croceicoccus sp.]|nr:hypothetical protein [Croceicoccus sp.]MAL26024.1 hypothetical protein [Croceicoccus sp.]|tara:strand:+ start:21194 stop:21748 length:555 start_codon:yes stop_codon:yes gene_type:complete